MKNYPALTKLLPSSLTELKAFRLQTNAERCRQSFSYFVQQAWHVIEPATPLKWNWHLSAICDHLQAVSEGRIKKLIINVPPRTGKSNIVSVLWPCWEWARNPSSRWLFATYNLQKLSLPLATKRRDVLLSEWYQERFGDKVQLAPDQREKSNFKNTEQGAMLATATGAVVTGLGGSRLVLDDPQDPDGAESELVRESTIQWLNMTWPSRKDSPEAAEVLIQQRLHERDATGLFLSQGGWVLLKIPMRYQGDPNPTDLGYRDPRTVKGEVLQPERFPPDFLEDLTRRLGPYGTSGQLEQEPAPPEGGLIKRSWIRHYEESNTTEGRRLALPGGEYRIDPENCVKFATVDLAVTEKDIKSETDPDYTVMASWAIFRSHRGPFLILLDLIRDRMEGPDILAKLAAFHKHWRFSVIGVESVAFQVMIVQQALRLGLPVREISQKADAIYKLDRDKVGRAISSTPLMADGRFFVPTYAPWLGDYIKELIVFPNAAHDDMLDATTSAIGILHSLGGSLAEPPPAPAPKRGDPYRATGMLEGVQARGTLDSVLRGQQIGSP